MTTWPLMVGLAVYSRGHARADRSLAEHLAARPRAARGASAQRRRGHVLEILVLALVGLHLAIALYGTAFLAAFGNTPWMGTRIGPLDLVALAVLVLIAGRHLRNRRTV